jgi:hypothetical protein
MSLDLDEFGQPLRRLPAHYGASAVAVVCAVVLQVGWLEVYDRPEFDSWWPLDAVLLVVATGYLLALAELHWRAAAWRPSGLVPRLWLLGRALGANLVIGTFVLLILWRAADSATMAAGLWIVPAALLGALAASVIAIAWALGDGWQRYRTDIPPNDVPRGKPRSELVHGLLAVGLILTLYAIERIEPHYSSPAGASPPAAQELSSPVAVSNRIWRT